MALIDDTHERDHQSCRRLLLFLRNTGAWPISRLLIEYYRRAVEEGYPPDLAMSTALLLADQRQDGCHWSYYRAALEERIRRTHGYWTGQTKTKKEDQP